MARSEEKVFDSYYVKLDKIPQKKYELFAKTCREALKYIEDTNINCYNRFELVEEYIKERYYYDTLSLEYILFIGSILRDINEKKNEIERKKHLNRILKIVKFED